MDFHSFWSDALATVLGGSVLTLLLFILREKVFPIPNMAGCWYIESSTSESAYRPYGGMSLKYQVMIWQDGQTIRGSSEKIYEHSSSKIGSYDRTTRKHGRVEGYITHRYLGKDRVQLLVSETGSRITSTVFELEFTRDKSALTGSFSTTVASSSGTAIWSRQRNSTSFTEAVREEIQETIDPHVPTAVVSTEKPEPEPHTEAPHP